MQNRPFVISVLSFNHPEHTSKCLDSILKLTAANNVNLIHNGSELKHKISLKNKYPQITHFEIETNGGFTLGANTAFKEGFKVSNHVLFLSNDTELLELPAKPPTSLSSIKILKRNTAEVDSVMGAINLKNGKLKHLKKLQDLNPNEITYVPGTAFWLDRSTYDKLINKSTLELFDERFHTYWEDVDLSIRAHKLNVSINYDEHTVCKHKIGKTCHKNRFYTYELYQRNRGRCLTKNNLTSLQFYYNYTLDLLKYSKSDYKTLFRIIRNHRLS